MNRPFKFTDRVRSFRYAVRGIVLTFKSQHNAWIHAAATIVVLVGAYWLEVSHTHWCIIILTCAAVWTAEALNTAFEFLADATTKEFNPVVGQAKDVAAGAVLITAFAAVVVGILVFTPYLIDAFFIQK
jgi:diacylglycerol kinase